MRLDFFSGNLFGTVQLTCVVKRVVLRVQTGVRFSRDLWDRFKGFCQAQGYRANAALELLMTAALQSGSVKSAVDVLIVRSEEQRAVDRVMLRRELANLSSLTEAARLEFDSLEKNHWMGTLPEVERRLSPAVEEVLGVLPRVNDKAMIDQTDRQVAAAMELVRLERRLRAERGLDR